LGSRTSSTILRKSILKITIIATILLASTAFGGTAVSATPTCNGLAVTIDGNTLPAGKKIKGTDGDDVILGTPGDDDIDAKKGNDTVCAGDGDDKVKGGDGDDNLFGEDGADDIDGGKGTDSCDDSSDDKKIKNCEIQLYLSSPIDPQGDTGDSSSQVSQGGTEATIFQLQQVSTGDRGATLGVNKDGVRLVDDGFSYNAKSIDVEQYFTPYPLVTVPVGEQNVAEFKIYNYEGPDKISHFELAFGLAVGESIGMSKVVINWDKSFDGIETVTLDDPGNVLENIKVTTSEGSCSDETETECLIVKIEHTFRAPLESNTFATNFWDDKRNAWQNYYNHGIEVVGESMNPPEIHDGINKGQIYHLTETGRNTAVDEFGNAWTLDKTWTKDYIPKGKIVDGITMHGIDRVNSLFNAYKQDQQLLAQESMDQLCPFCSDKEFAEINDIFAYTFTNRNSLEFSEYKQTQADIAVEQLLEICNTCLTSYEDVDNSQLSIAYPKAEIYRDDRPISVILAEEREMQKILADERAYLRQVLAPQQ